MNTKLATVLMLLCLAGLLVGAYELLITAATDYFFFMFVGIDQTSVLVSLQDPYLWVSIFLIVGCSVGFNRSRDFTKLETVKQPFLEEQKTD